MFTSNGTFTVPSGVTELLVTLTGGGGGGGGAQGTYAGGGGGAGGVLQTVLPVTPGETLAVQIGQGGAGGTIHDELPLAGEAGSTTYLLPPSSSATPEISAEGGSGGLSASPAGRDSGGEGGSPSAGSDTTILEPTHDGANGASATGTATCDSPEVGGAGGGFPGAAGSGGAGATGSCRASLSNGSPGQSGSVVIIPLTNYTN